MATTTGVRIFLSPFLCWIFTVSLALVWTPVQGNYQLIGAAEPVVAVPGEDVILPCHLDPEKDVQDWTVEWSKPDLKSIHAQRRSDVVFLYRVRTEVHDMMIVSYIGRTSLFTDGLKRGDMSLQIRNVTLEDEARYRCFSPSLPREEREAFVQLVVDPNFTASTTETPLLPTEPSSPPREGQEMSPGRSRLAVLVSFISVSVFVALLAATAFFLQRKHQNRNNEASSRKTTADAC